MWAVHKSYGPIGFIKWLHNFFFFYQRYEYFGLTVQAQVKCWFRSFTKKCKDAEFVWLDQASMSTFSKTFTWLVVFASLNTFFKQHLTSWRVVSCIDFTRAGHLSMWNSFTTELHFACEIDCGQEFNGFRVKKEKQLHLYYHVLT